MGWFAEQVIADGREVLYLPCTDKEKQPWRWIVLVDEPQWEAMTCEWKSPWGAWSAKQGLRGALPMCVGALPTSSPAPILKVAARSCFWQLPLTTMRMFADYLAIRTDTSMDLFDTLHAMISSILAPIDETELMDIMMLRFASGGKSAAACTPEFLELQDASPW